MFPVTFQTRQFFRFAAVVMALVLLWRNQRYDDKYIMVVAAVTLAVDGFLFVVKSKEVCDS